MSVALQPAVGTSTPVSAGAASRLLAPAVEQMMPLQDAPTVAAAVVMPAPQSEQQLLSSLLAEAPLSATKKQHTERKAKAEPKAKAKAEPKAKARPKAKAQPQPKAEADSHLHPKVSGKAEPKPEAKMTRRHIYSRAYHREMTRLKHEDVASAKESARKVAQAAVVAAGL